MDFFDNLRQKAEEEGEKLEPLLRPYNGKWVALGKPDGVTDEVMATAATYEKIVAEVDRIDPDHVVVEAALLVTLPSS